ncbi:uncharacterized protein [Apostichopus japonicus]|uniref:uncharacterized protein isoform X2 n=1 Tax=Stichopus japonicus TaxID=307972 RepID=UPI003AB28414
MGRPIEEILQKWGVEELIDKFQENGIDVTAFALLDELSIKELIPKVGLRLKFLKGWREEFQLPSQQLQFLPLDVSTSASSSSSCVDIEDEGTSISQDESLCDTDTSFQPPPLKREKRVHFDVRNILIENANGRRAMKNTDENKFCNKADRHSIVELCISHMMECHGDKPSSFIKGALAQAIVIAFPCLNDSDAPLGYEAWYCKGAKGRPATGYLEEHLRYRRKRVIAMNEPEKGKKKDELPKEGPMLAPVAPENEEELVMMNQWLKYNKEPEDQVTVFMGKTAFYRQKRIKESLGSVNTTIAEFPRLLDPGMIEQDFALLYPSRSNKLYQRWEKVARKVILYSQQLNWREVLGMQNTNIDDLTMEEIKNLAFSLLAIIFRSGRSGKGRKGHNSANDSVNCFIDVQPEVFDIDQYVKTLKATDTPQPFVVCRGSRITPSQTYVIIERNALPQQSLMKAIDVCFKAMYIFDIEYQPTCKIAWQFLQVVIYDFTEASITSSIRNLRAFIASDSK